MGSLIHVYTYVSSYSQTGFTNFRCQTGVQPEIFKSRGDFLKLGHFDKHFVRNKEKGPAGKNFSVFFPTLKTTFWMEYLTRKMDTIRIFFPKSGHVSRFSKKGGEFSPYPYSCVPDKIVFRNCSSTSSYLFSVWRKYSFIFVLQILAMKQPLTGALII